MAKHIKRSVLPVYFVGVVWLVFGLFLSLSKPLDYVLCTIISGAVFVLAKGLFPDKSYQIPDEAPKPETKKRDSEADKRTKAPKATGNPEIDKLLLERERAVSEMRRLNDSIEDAVISAQIDHLEHVTQSIIDEVVKHPSKLPQIRRFLNYFLPTTLKILNAYDRMDSVGVDGENITATKARVEAMMTTISNAFDKQLDSLFGEEAVDVSTDITVMENLLIQEGLSEGSTSRRASSTTDSDGGVTLEL